MACVDIVEPTRSKRTASDIEAAGGRAIAIVCDVTDSGRGSTRPWWRPSRRFGRIDTVFDAAAYSEPKYTVADMPVETWKAVIEVNLTGMFIVAKLAIPHLKAAGGGGTIVLVSSIYGHIGASERPAYCASKGGVRMLAKAIAIDHADDNIRANAILPGADRDPAPPATQRLDGRRARTPRGAPAPAPPGPARRGGQGGALPRERRLHLHLGIGLLRGRGIHGDIAAFSSPTGSRRSVRGARRPPPAPPASGRGEGRGEPANESPFPAGRGLG